MGKGISLKHGFAPTYENFKQEKKNKSTIQEKEIEQGTTETLENNNAYLSIKLNIKPKYFDHVNYCSKNSTSSSKRF